MAGFSPFAIFLTLCLISASLAVPKLKERTDEEGEEWIGPIRKCPLGNDDVINECVRKITKDLTPLLGAGIEELGLVPMEPITIKKFLYEQKLGAFGNITLFAKDVSLSNFLNYKTMKFRSDLKNQRMYFTYEVPYIGVQANYKLSGRVGFFPLKGAGPAQIEIFNLKAEGEINAKTVKREDGVNIIQVFETKFSKLNIQDMNLRIRGLFDGNPAMSSVVHYFGKRYAPQIFEVIRPELAEYAGDVITHQLLNPAFKHLPHLVTYVE